MGSAWDNYDYGPNLDDNINTSKASAHKKKKDYDAVKKLIEDAGYKVWYLDVSLKGE